MIYLFNHFVTSEGMKNAGCKEIHSLFEGRLIENRKYLINCLTVKNAYIFLKKVIDFYL